MEQERDRRSRDSRVAADGRREAGPWVLDVRAQLLAAARGWPARAAVLVKLGDTRDYVVSQAMRHFLRRNAFAPNAPACLWVCGWLVHGRSSLGSGGLCGCQVAPAQGLGVSSRFWNSTSANRWW